MPLNMQSSKTSDNDRSLLELKEFYVMPHKGHRFNATPHRCMTPDQDCIMLVET
jgi:hypothetical protein